MPIDASVDPARQLTTHKIIGKVSSEEAMITLRQFWEGQPTLHLVCDVREVKASDLTEDDFNRFVEYICMHSEKRTGGKTALVASGDICSGLSWAVDMLGDTGRVPFKFKVFRSMEEAQHWIDKDL